MKNTHFTYQFVDNYSLKSFETQIHSEGFRQVSVDDLLVSGINYGEQIPLQCYDNVSRTLIKNFGCKPEIRFCIGLLQDKINPNQIVEHCWTEQDGLYFDAIEERTRSIYWLYQRPFTMNELVEIGRITNRHCLPNITTIMEVARNRSVA